jgi:hypothetical protein
MLLLGLVGLSWMSEQLTALDVSMIARAVNQRFGSN